jgi:hypothetical protein
MQRFWGRGELCLVSKTGFSPTWDSQAPGKYCFRSEVDSKEDGCVEFLQELE